MGRTLTCGRSRSQESTSHFSAVSVKLGALRPLCEAFASLFNNKNAFVFRWRKATPMWLGVAS